MSLETGLLEQLLESHQGMVDRILWTYERSPEARADLDQDPVPSNPPNGPNHKSAKSGIPDRAP